MRSLCKWITRGIVFVITARIFYAVLMTFLQYRLWGQNEISQFLLPPHQPLRYFLYYSWGRFWLNPVLSIASAGVFYGFLLVVKKYRQILFGARDARVALLATSALPWPGIVIFIPLAFCILAIMTFINSLRAPGSRTAFVPALIVAALIAFFFSGRIIEIFNLSALKI